MEKLCIVVVAFAIGYVESAKTPGQLLDDAIHAMRVNSTFLESIFNKRMERMEKAIRSLQTFHDSCAPCRTHNEFLNTCDCTMLDGKQDCEAHLKAGFKANGLYKVNSPKSMKVYCDQTTMGGGWTVIQRRKDGSEDFNRKWDDYKRGFGSIDGEFWLGNDQIHGLTVGPRNAQLLINMRMKGKKEMVYAKFNVFGVGDEASGYVLKLNMASGNVTYNHFGYQNNMKFSTPDRDNDLYAGSCATKNKSGWWYTNWRCFQTDLNGPYIFGHPGAALYWNSEWKMQPEFVEMLLKKNK